MSSPVFSLPMLWCLAHRLTRSLHTQSDCKHRAIFDKLRRKNFKTLPISLEEGLRVWGWSKPRGKLIWATKICFRLVKLILEITSPVANNAGSQVSNPAQTSFWKERQAVCFKPNILTLQCCIVNKVKFQINLKQLMPHYFGTMITVNWIIILP